MFLSQEQGAGKRKPLCLEVTFDAKVYGGLSEASGPAGVILGRGMAQEGWLQLKEV